MQTITIIVTALSAESHIANPECTSFFGRRNDIHGLLRGGSGLHESIERLLRYPCSPSPVTQPYLSGTPFLTRRPEVRLLNLDLHRSTRSTLRTVRALFYL